MSDSRIVVEFVAMDAKRFANVPAEVRLRQLLKVAGRRLGLRCTGVRSQLELHGLAEDSSAATDAANFETRQTVDHGMAWDGEPNE